MKIAIITKRFHLNLSSQVKALKDAGHEVSLLVWGKGKCERYNDIEPFIIGFSPFFGRLNKLIEKIPNKKIVHFLKFRLPFLNLEEMINLKRLREKIKEIHPDISLVRGYPAFPFFMMMIYAKLYGGQVYLMSQLNKHYGETIRKKIYLLFLKNILRVQGIITPLKNVLPKADPFYIYLPFIIEAPDFSKTYFKDDKVNILEIGKFMARKEHLLMLEAVKCLRNKYDLSLTIIGERLDEDLYRKIINYIETENLSGIVKVESDLPNDEVLQKFRSMDLFVLPSHSEPAAYSPLEAMANKLPVIISDTSGTKCYIKEGENGYIFKSHDVDDLVEKIERVIKDRNILIKMGENSYEIVKKEHSLAFFQQEFAKLIIKK